MGEPVRRRYGDDDAQFVEIYEPLGEPRGSAVLFHGGYWRDRYGLDLMEPMARHLAGRGWRVVNVEYRRVGVLPGIWDAMAADVLAAAAIAQPAPVVAIGHSAGGHLALWVTANASDVDAVVALAPLADLDEADRRNLSDGAVRLLLGGGRAVLPERYATASPIRLVPLGRPQLVIHGDADDSVPQDISTDYAAAATEAGDPVELVTPAGVDHFHLIDPAHDVWRLIDDRLDRWAPALNRRRDGGGGSR